MLPIRLLMSSFIEAYISIYSCGILPYRVHASKTKIGIFQVTCDGIEEHQKFEKVHTGSGAEEATLIQAASDGTVVKEGGRQYPQHNC